MTGVSGSGKSTLINNTLYPAMARHLHGGREQPAAHAGITGLDQFDKDIGIDQSPIARTPRANAAYYRDLFNPLPEIFDV